MIANNSMYNNVFFFVSVLKKEYHNKLFILYHNALDRRGKIFCITTYFEKKKSFKIVSK